MKKLLLLISLAVIILGSITTAFALSYQKGDANKDSRVNIIDATTIQKRVAKKITFDGEQCYLADVDFDGAVTVKDAVIIQKTIANPTEEETTSKPDDGTVELPFVPAT